MDLNWKEKLGEEILSEFLNTSLSRFYLPWWKSVQSLTLSIWEKKKTMIFKASVKKWIKENIGIISNRRTCGMIYLCMSINNFVQEPGKQDERTPRTS